MKKCFYLKPIQTQRIKTWGYNTAFQPSLSCMSLTYQQYVPSKVPKPFKQIPFQDILAQLCFGVEPSLAFATRTTSKLEMVTRPGLYRKLIEFRCIVVWHMSVHSLTRGHVIRVCIPGLFKAFSIRDTCFCQTYTYI